ncbi:MAG: hypothetical protein ACJAYE_001208 [Candidatus Azotimanducaceae bacterium]|jgi:hypothetical protein
MKKPKDAPNRWQLVRDLIGFQFKLALDGLRDLFLSPISIIAGVAGIIFSPDNPGKYFNRLLGLGHRSDIWINLFGASEHYVRDPEATSSDAYIGKLEELLVAEYQKGGVVKNVKDRTDNLINQISKKTDQDV